MGKFVNMSELEGCVCPAKSKLKTNPLVNYGTVCKVINSLMHNSGFEERCLQ